MREIDSFTAAITAAASSRDDIARACARVYDAFIEIAAPVLPSDDPESQRLDSGLALSPLLAAKCLLDGQRTAAFVRGCAAAIREASRRFGCADVLYAGTGPFGPLALLALPLLDAPNVRFTLLDANAYSVRAVSRLIDALGVGAYVRNVIQADATTYQHPSEIHVLISETMQRTLAEEPFVAIVRNLRQQLAPGGILLPERVSIALALLDAQEEQARWGGADVPFRAEQIGEVFEIDREGERPAEGEGTTLHVPAAEDGALRWLSLITRITVSATEVLEPYASGLTVPEILWPVSPVMRESAFSFRYRTGPRPGIEWSAVQS